MQERLEAILRGHPGERSELIPLLQEVQDAFGYIPPEALRAVARHLGLGETAAYAVATFYSQFYLERRGRHTVKVCQGTACHVRGGKDIMRAVRRRLGITPGQTTPDYAFSLERVACFGSCALAPVVVIDGKVHGRMTPRRVEELLGELA